VPERPRYCLWGQVLFDVWSANLRAPKLGRGNLQIAHNSEAIHSSRRTLTRRTRQAGPWPAQERR
jgi:hypothetical protein